MPKYYIGELQGLKDDFVFYKYSSSLQNQIYDAPKEKYGNFIFTETLGGFKEVLTGKVFKYIDSGYDLSYPYIQVPTTTGLFMDKEHAIEVPAKDKEKVLHQYSEKYTKEQLTEFFEKAQRKSDMVLPTGNNKSDYYVARLVGINDNFKYIPSRSIDYSIFEAEKEDYGEFIFKKTINGYEEVLTGKRFKFQVQESEDGYLVYKAPKDTGLLVDRNSEHMIPKALLDKKLEEYRSNNNKEQLSQLFEELQQKSDRILSDSINNMIDGNNKKRL